MSKAKKHDDATLDHVLKYTGVFGGIQGINILMGVVRNRLASEFLGVAGFGLIGLYTSVTELVNNCSNCGIPISSVQHISELFEEGDDAQIRAFVRVVRTWCLWSALLAALICLTMAAVKGDMHIALLVPMCMSLIITGGEISILKGLRRLKRVAVISLLAAVTTFSLAVPIFWTMGVRGIILSLNATAVVIMIIHLCFSTPLYHWQASPFSRDIFRAGIPLLRIGIPYVLTGGVGAAAAVILQSFLKGYSSADTLGYYRVCYTITVSYAGIIFMALESDYFPRLSSVNHDLTRCNQTINQQIRACMLLLSPMLIALALIMPQLMPILFAKEFLPAVGMTVCAVFYMFFRCLSVPIAYVALAHGDSKIYMALEILYDVFMLGAVIGCYILWDLYGIGLGLSLAALIDVLLVSICYHYKYHFRLERATYLLTIKQFVYVGLGVLVCLTLPMGLKWGFGIVLFVLSTISSYRVLRSESDFFRKKFL